MRHNATRATFLMLMLCMMSIPVFSQIYAPEGLNMPGAFNAWTNPPYINSMAGIQKAGGTLLLDASLQTRMYRTLIYIDAVGADTVGGTYEWLFTSGPGPGGYYNNKWSGTAVIIDSIQTYTKEHPTNNSITLTNGNYYTVNYKDNGYANTQAIWIQTATAPVPIISVSQSPSGGIISPNTPVTVTVGYGSPLPGTQSGYVRYTTDNFATSTLTSVTFTGAAYTATIPGQSAGTEVKYYTFTTKSSFSPVWNPDLMTLKYNNNGGANYYYAVPTPDPQITATAGPHGAISPSGVVHVPATHDTTFTFTPDPGYYVDSIIVDNVYKGDSTQYTFTNVLLNHTIRVVFGHNVNVTFQVNMKVKMQNGTFRPDLGDIVSANGSFNGWTPAVDTLKDPNADSIYTKTKLLKAGTHHEYKFWKTDRGGLSWEDHVSNRQLDVPDADSTLPAVYFDNAGPDVNVTFQVNMRVQMINKSFHPDSGDVVTVRGSFNDWGNSTNNPDTLKDLDNDSIYTRTMTLASVQTIQYKFWKTMRDGVDFETISNRSYEIPPVDNTIPVVYFNDASSPNLVTFAVTNRWNLVSVPNTVDDYLKSAVFPTATTNAFAYVGTYSQKDTLANGPGYWLKFGEDQDVTIFGTPILQDSISVTTGWNLIGSITTAVATSSIGEAPSGLILTNFFGYNNGYSSADSIRPGKGYWVKTGGDGKLALGYGPGANPKTVAQPGSELEKYAEITIEDAAGNMQHLYLGESSEKNLKASAYEMPPVPPTGIFDARFASGAMAEIALQKNARELPIVISSASYPVKISWNLKASTVNASLAIGSREISMNANGSTTVASSKQQVVIKTGGSFEVPVSFSLEQNYPNPFNPTTTISYGLPVDSRVRVTIYNLLGQQVTALVNEVKPSGWHTASWDAAQYPSGLYFYRVNAVSVKDTRNAFSDVKKMMLVK